MSNFEPVERLEGSRNEVGGLIIKSNSKKDNSEFKRPTESLLGLRKLAEDKRKQNHEEEKRKNRDALREQDDEDDEYISSKKRHKDSRKYRAYKPETPSHPGGVSEEARARIRARQEREREKGVYADTRDSKKKRKEGRYEEKYSEYSSKDDYDYGKRRKEDKYKDRDRSKKRSERGSSDEREKRQSSTWRGYEQWEDTPGRSSRRSGDESERRTPRIDSRGLVIFLSGFLAVGWKDYPCAILLKTVESIIHLCCHLETFPLKK